MSQESAPQSKKAARKRAVSVTSALWIKTTPHIARLVSCAEVQTLDKEELKSIYALLAYVAYNRNMPKKSLEAAVEARFGIDRVDDIQRQDYEQAIRFLIDLSTDKILH